MSDTKISGLTAVTTPAAADEFAVNQGGSSKKVNLGQLSAAVANDPYDVGNSTLNDATFLLQYQELRLTSTERLTMAGTAEAYVSDFGAYTSPLVGSPKSGSFTVPSNYVYDLIARLSIANQSRTTLLGSADLILTGDFASRQRIILTG